jgi:hypothetical protein
MKLKVIKRDYKEVETNLELPVYLYFQDELCNDELVKITEKEKITIKYYYNSFTISVESNYTIEDLNFERCQTTEEHFNECYSEALKQLHSAVNELLF